MPESPNSTAPLVLTVNGGSSSVKFAVYEPGPAGHRPHRRASGKVERIGQEGTELVADGSEGGQPERRPIAAPDHGQAAAEVVRWLRERVGGRTVAGVGHRVVHGGVHLVDHQLVTPDLIAELRRNEPLDLAHLPREIALLEAFGRQFPGAPQVACFDTAFHRELPRVAQMLPVPRRYFEAGVRRLGFHGLSYTYLMEELRRLAGPAVADGRLILAHLGSGASMAAVRNGKPIDTTMSFTPLAGLVMGTRPGDLDPGLLVYLMRTEGWSLEQTDDFLSHHCGLLGVSDSSPDMRDLVARRESDSRAAEAVDLFCYQACKCVGALSAALGGLDTLVFAGGIGEHSPPARAGICDGLEYLGVNLDTAANEQNAEAISANGSGVKVRVIPTDEEVVIAQAVYEMLGQAK